MQGNARIKNKMEKIKVAKYVSEFLVKNGITDCFMVTGGGAMHLDDAIGHQEGLHCTFNHHEQACAIAAEGYTRMTGKLAAVCVTSGPGGTNAITGVMGGWVDSIPMFILTGQVKRETTIWSCPDLGLRQLGDQEFDITHSVANMTKYCVMVTDSRDIAYHLEKALYLSRKGRGGPVWLDIPLDVQAAMIDETQLSAFDPAELPALFDGAKVDTQVAVQAHRHRVLGRIGVQALGCGGELVGGEDRCLAGLAGDLVEVLQRGQHRPAGVVADAAVEM